MFVNAVVTFEFGLGTQARSLVQLTRVKLWRESDVQYLIVTQVWLVIPVGKWKWYQARGDSSGLCAVWYWESAFALILCFIHITENVGSIYQRDTFPSFLYFGFFLHFWKKKKSGIRALVIDEYLARRVLQIGCNMWSANCMNAVYPGNIQCNY